jgi:hypothetical protein
MTRFEIVATSLFYALTVVAANAGTTKQFVVSKDAQAVTIAQMTLGAMGGTSALLGYQDGQATGSLTVYAGNQAATYPVVLECKGTQETRVEIQKPTGTNVRIVNQGQGVIEKSNGTVVHLMMNNTLAERVGHIPILSILGEYLSTNVSLQYQGTAQVGGQNANIIAVSYVPTTDPVQGPIFAAMTQTLFYIDQATGLVDKIQYSNWDESNASSSQKVELYLSNYQVVNGISLPFRQTTYTDGTLYSDLALNSVSFNVGLSDSEFTLPQ